MSKTRDLRDANETISTLFRSQDLEGRSSSSTEPPRPKFRGGGEEGGFGGEEDFVLPGQMTGGPGFGGNPHRTPPRTRNHFEELYLQSQRKYDEVFFFLNYFIFLFIFVFFVFFSFLFLFFFFSFLFPFLFLFSHHKLSARNHLCYSHLRT